MALCNKRIVDLPERATLNSDDYTVVDGSNGGTGKYKFSKIQDDINDLKEDFSDIETAFDNIVSYHDNVATYDYEENVYYNGSGVKTSLNGYNTYTIPVSSGDIVRLSWADLSSTPWGTAFTNNEAIKIWTTENEFSKVVTSATNADSRMWVQNKEAIILAMPSDVSHITVTALPENASKIRVEINTSSPALIDSRLVRTEQTVYTVNSRNAIQTQFYYAENIDYLNVMGASIKVFVLNVKQGDVFTFGAIPTGLSFRASLKSGGVITKVGTVINYPFVYTVPSDGVMCVFCPATEDGIVLRSPANQIQIDAKNIIGLENGTQFNGLSGVAFGTSLTYNASVGNGYLTRLSSLSGITFDNQGVGSSTILGDGGSLDMLAKIKAYTSYSGKRVCLLEGFVNDWYGGNALGTWTDTAETTVCGCVRSAINYMLTQNANMTVFLILDHYGRAYNTLDCSTTHKNASDLTQFEYYSEIEKVANSLGVPVIREFELSGISELMPQYLADNIHLNALGAIQSANVIWNEMKQHPLNAE